MSTCSKGTTQNETHIHTHAHAHTFKALMVEKHTLNRNLITQARGARRTRRAGAVHDGVSARQVSGHARADVAVVNVAGSMERLDENGTAPTASDGRGYATRPIGSAVSAHGSAASPFAEHPAQYLRPSSLARTSDRRDVTPRRDTHTHTHARAHARIGARIHARPPHTSWRNPPTNVTADRSR